MTEEVDVKLERQIDKDIYEFGLGAAKQILAANPDLNPQLQFRFSSKDANVMEKLVKNADASTFLSLLDYQINDKFIVQGQIDAKIYYLIFKELGLNK